MNNTLFGKQEIGKRFKIQSNKSQSRYRKEKYHKFNIFKVALSNEDFLGLRKIVSSNLFVIRFFFGLCRWQKGWRRVQVHVPRGHRRGCGQLLEVWVRKLWICSRLLWSGPQILISCSH